MIKAAAKCSNCGNDIQGAMGKGADYIAAYTKKKFGVCMCFDCASKRNAEAEKSGVNDDGKAEVD